MSARGSILERAELPVTVEPSRVETQVLPPSELETPHDAQIKFLDVQISEVEAPIGVWAKKLLAEVRFQLTGPEVETITADCIPYRIEVYTVDTESGAPNLVASNQSKLQPKMFEYSSQLAFLVPEVGRYELHSIVLLLPPCEMLAHHRGPTLKYSAVTRRCRINEGDSVIVAYQ